ncbi:MAG: ComF family protein [Alphaproteobacteria bacterium]|nr:MAG: ComF family protein [Alphaproteobacteria bacterium]
MVPWLGGSGLQATRAAEHGRWLIRLGRQAMDALLPPRCLGCGDLVPEPARLCGACWSALNFITAPLCAHCGDPFEFPVAGLRRCAACIARPPGYDQARAALVYDDASKPLVLGLKHGDRTEYVPLLARLLLAAGRELLDGTDLLIPVPLHRWRLWRRRFNQSALLAQALGRLASRPVALDLLRRVRATPSQGGLNARQRRRNVHRAFTLKPDAAAMLEGRRVLLVDDVLTTGATIEACTRPLRRAGVAWVGVITVTRVVRVQDITI